MHKVVPKDEEYLFDANVIISQTNLSGTITYTNKSFCKISAYEADELIGKSHSIIRHPNMPKELFEKMWSVLQGGEVWTGIVKNLRKDGLYYWVDTEILPTRDQNGTITGYIAVRKPASRKNIQESEELYSKMLASENKG